jgi:hypothetical protein
MVASLCVGTAAVESFHFFISVSVKLSLRESWVKGGFVSRYGGYLENH